MIIYTHAAGDRLSGAIYGVDDVTPGAAYRLALWRFWTPLLQGVDERLCVFVMLNPSTATHTEDDPTIRRCIGFAKRWGFDGLGVVNLFALRSTDPKALYSHVAPEGDPENYRTIEEWCRRADRVVCAWGNHGKLHGRDAVVSNILRAYARDIVCFRVTKEGQPEHPLYQPWTREMLAWGGA